MMTKVNWRCLDCVCLADVNMTVHNIVHYVEDPQVLRQHCKPVSHFNRRTIRLVQDLMDTLAACDDGIGLSAPQIDIHERILIACLGSELNGQWQSGSAVVMINPMIIDSGDERRDFDGCLSFPGLYGVTRRPHWLRVTGLDGNGKRFNQVYSGFNAVVVHHEIDHLEGILFIDRIEKEGELYTLDLDEENQVFRVPVSLNLYRHPEVTKESQ